MQYTNYFVYFVLARFMLDLGRKVSWIALAWFVYEITGAASAIGFVITAATIAPLISGVAAGIVLDHVNRRMVMIGEVLVRSGVLLLIPLLHWTGLLSLTMIIVLSFINGLLSTFTEVGSTTILPSIVLNDNLQKANAIMTMCGQIGYLAGPALGGFLTAVMGAPWTLIMTVMFYLLAVIFYICIPYNSFHNKWSGIESQGQKAFSFVQRLKETLVFLQYNRVLIVIALVTLMFNFTYAPLEPVLPVYIGEVLQAGSKTLGGLWSAFAVGALIGSLLWVHLNIRVPYSYSLGTVIVLWGFAPLLLSQIREIYILYITMFMGGMFFAPYNIIEPALEQQLVPDYIRGRVIAMLGVISGIGFPIGTFLGGVLGDLIGASNTIFLSGISTILLGITIFFSKSLYFSSEDVGGENGDYTFHDV